MTKAVTIYSVTNLSDPADTQEFYTTVKEAKAVIQEYIRYGTDPSSIDFLAHTIELNKKGLCKALNSLPWR